MGSGGAAVRAYLDELRRTVKAVQATNDPASIGTVDYAIFCVKLWDVESAGAAIKPIVGRETAVIPQQVLRALPGG